jgi:hypothetical protein
MTNPKEDWMTVDKHGDAGFDPVKLARKAKSFDRAIRLRNFREYAACGLVFALFGYLAMRAPGNAESTALVLVAVGALIAAVQIGRFGTPTRPRAEHTADAVLHDWRFELERQAKLLEGVRLNYLAPFCPGFVLLALAPLIDGRPYTGGLLLAALMLALFGLVLWFVDRLNRRAAAHLRAIIAGLSH